MFELLIIAIFHKRMFNAEIYKHQKLAIIINILFPCLLKIATIVLAFHPESFPLILYKKEKLLIPIGIIIYIILIIFRSYINSKIKWYMDLKYISLSKLLMYYGAIGSSICIIIATISTFKNCNIYQGSRFNNTLDYICPVNQTLNETLNETENFIDSYYIYINKFKGIEILKEITKIILGIITFFFNKYFYILIIKCLTPIYVVFSIPIFYFLQKITLLIYTLIFDAEQFVNIDKIIYLKFVLDISGDLVSFFGFLIYLEIIIFNCWKLNYNIRNNISERSFRESYGIQRSQSLFSEDDSELGDDNNDTISNK